MFNRSPHFGGLTIKWVSAVDKRNRHVHHKQQAKEQEHMLQLLLIAAYSRTKSFLRIIKVCKLVTEWSLILWQFIVLEKLWAIWPSSVSLRVVKLLLLDWLITSESSKETEDWEDFSPSAFLKRMQLKVMCLIKFLELIISCWVYRMSLRWRDVCIFNISVRVSLSLLFLCHLNHSRVFEV